MITISEIKNEYGISMALVILCTRIHFKNAEIDDLNAFIEFNYVDGQMYLKHVENTELGPWFTQRF